MNVRVITAAVIAVAVAAGVIAGGLLLHPRHAASVVGAAAIAGSTTAIVVPASTPLGDTAVSPSPSTTDGPMLPPALSAGRAGPPPLDQVQQRHPDQVAMSVAAELYSFDAAVDHETAPAQRAAYLLTPSLATALATPAADGPSADWQVWSYRHDWSSLTVEITELPWALPADTGVSATRVVELRRDIHDAERVTSQPPVTLQITLARVADTATWKVGRIEVP